MESLSFQYPGWYLIFCLLLGLAYAMFLYYRDNTFREQSKSLNWILGGIRFFCISLLAILLLSPLLKSLLTETKKPVVILAQDQSESIAAEMDEAALTAYRADFEQLKTNLEEEYEVKEYAFGNEVREGIDFTFEDKLSNISKLLGTVYDTYSNQNLGAVVLATDGIYNEGSNPIYASTKLSVPIYTVALGDTTPKLDLVLKRVFHNKIAYLGDKFKIQVDIAAQNCNGNNTSLNVYKVDNDGTQRLQQYPLNIDNNDFFRTREIILDADQSGVQRFRISLAGVSGEVTTENNVKDIFVDVLDARQKILIAANSPHPDITAIKQSIATNKNYEVEVAYINDFQKRPEDFDFIILHQLPAAGNNASFLLNAIGQRKIPRLFVVGSQINMGLINSVQDLVNIRANTRNTNEVQGRIAPNFSLFTIEEDILSEIPNFPPLLAPFGEFEASPEAQVLMYQRIGKIDTQYPLLVLGESNGAKTGVLCAEGLWKWRLFDYLQRQDHDIFDSFLGKTVQYLALKEDKRKFRVNLSKNIFDENEPILLDAELYNESYELVNESDVTIIITNSEGNEFPFTFNKVDRAYRLNAGIFPVGNYRFRASVFSNGEDLSYSGQFSVQPIQKEIYETTADHGLLRLLSDKYGGELVYPAQLKGISGQISEKGTVKPVVYTTSKTRPVINLKWIFFLLLGLLTTEWFFRRYFGGY